MRKNTLVISPKELQEELGVSRTTLWRLRRNNHLPKEVHVGGQFLGWRRASIEAWLIASETQEAA